MTTHVSHSSANPGSPAVTVTITGELRIQRLPAGIREALIRSHTFPNPEFIRKRNLGFWTGGLDAAIRLWRDAGDALILPRGALPEVLTRCQEASLAVRTVDETIAPPLPHAVTMAGSLYPFQARAVEALLRADTGVLVSPTGSGKTNMLLSLIPRRNTTVLILVHTSELLAQTRERCRSWLGIEAGILGGGKRDLRPVTVAMVQTVAKDPAALAGNFGAVLVDEAHHSPASTWSAILNRLPARYKYGFTATPKRKDGLEMLLWSTLGPVTARIPRAEAEAAGKILRPAVETVWTDFQYDLPDVSQWGAMLGALIADPARNARIAEEVRRRMTAGTRALILTERVQHVRILAELLHDFDPVLLTGDLPKREREAAMTAVRSGAPLTIATTSLLGEGVDVPGWDLLFLATPMAAGARTLQAAGRVSRPAPGKTRAVVVDFIDRRTPALLAAGKSRQRMLQSA